VVLYPLSSKILKYLYHHPYEETQVGNLRGRKVVSMHILKSMYIVAIAKPNENQQFGSKISVKTTSKGR
jgi:hypothetical protein